MRVFWTALALLCALLVQTTLTRLLPSYAQVLDPFLLVLVYCGLTGGETHGMLAGAAAGWIQDIHFGGPVLGLSGLSKVLVGFLVGLAATRFHLGEPLPRAITLLAAAILDAGIFQVLCASFDVPAAEFSAKQLLARAAVNAALGALLYQVVERQTRRLRRA